MRKKKQEEDKYIMNQKKKIMTKVKTRTPSMNIHDFIQISCVIK